MNPIFLVRLLHTLISLFSISCLSGVYYSALRRRRGRALAVATGALLAEGAILVVNHGDCPLGAVHHRVGDDRTFFELFLPARAARAAVPCLTGVTILGFVLVALRPPR